MDREEFQDYVFSFYNAENGIYPDVGATLEEVIDATTKLLNSGVDVEFDSLDRERVRDIITQQRAHVI